MLIALAWDRRGLFILSDLIQAKEFEKGCHKDVSYTSIVYNLVEVQRARFLRCPSSHGEKKLMGNFFHRMSF